jgi:hypothetical protein
VTPKTDLFQNRVYSADLYFEGGERVNRYELVDKDTVRSIKRGIE